jgi:hypothetical protein
MKKIILTYLLLLLFATPNLMAGAIVGRVVHETYGSPASGVQLRCIGGRDRPLPGERLTDVYATTDKDGGFNIRELPPGSYDIIIKQIPDTAWTYRHLYDIIVSEKQDTPIKLMLVKGQLLSGIVQDCRGNSVGGALLDIGGTNVYFRTTSDDKGHFAIHVPTGDYIIEVIDAPGKYHQDMNIQMSTCNTELKFGYGPTVLVSVTNDKQPSPVHCILYPTMTQETHPPSDPAFETNLMTVATRHIVSWIAEGQPLPGITPIKDGYSTNRVDGNISFVCDYLPKEIQISTNPCINRLSRPEYKATTQERGWNKGVGYITIVWTKTGDSGHVQGFIVLSNFKNSCQTWHEVVFTKAPEGVKAKYKYLSHSHSSHF